MLPVLLLKRCGCKYPLIFFTLLYIEGFSLVAIATPATGALAHLGRAVTGLAVGGATPIGEFSTPF